jgi:type VI secretion system protein ImpC
MRLYKPGRMEFEFSTASGRQSQRNQASTFVMQVLGDFAGNITHAVDPAWLMQVPVRTVDLDNIDQLWSHFTPRLSIEIEGCLLSIEPCSLDDFHPDQLYQNLPVFDELRQLRQRLGEPSSSAEALAKMMAGLPDTQEPSSQNSSDHNDKPANESSDDMFQRLLGEPQRSTSP